MESNEQIQEELAKKQNFLRDEIINKGYDGVLFMEQIE